MVRRLTKEGLSPKEIYNRLKNYRLLDEQGQYWVWLEHIEFAGKKQYTLEDLKRHQRLNLSLPG
jgi:hypothetical protein